MRERDRRGGEAVEGPPISVETPGPMTGMTGLGGETRLAFLGLVDYCPYCVGPPRFYLPFPRPSGEPEWDGCFAAHNLDPAPDDPVHRRPPRPDLPRFA